MKETTGRLCAFALLLGVFSCAGPVATDSREVASGQALMLTDITVIDVEAGVERSHQSILVRDGVIQSIAPSDAGRPPDDAIIVDGRGKFVIPGLWDMHVHVLADWENAAALLVANGVTGVRNLHSTVEDPLGVALEIKAGLADGSVFGPELVANGPIMDGPHPIWPSSVPSEGAADARASVRELHASGADFIKVYDLLSRASYFAAMDEANRLGIPLDGHVPAALTLREVSDAGQRCVEHFDFVLEASTDGEREVRAIISTFFEALDRKDPSALDHLDRYRSALVERHAPEICADLLNLLAANQTWVCPTLVRSRKHLDVFDQTTGEVDPAFRYLPPSTREWWMQQYQRRHVSPEDTPEQWRILSARNRLEDAILLRAHAAGVPIVAGTDVGNPFLVPGFSLLDELELMVAAGLPPAAVLRSATIAPARLLGREDFGAVEVGRRADLVILDRNPLHDMSAVHDIHGVILRGRLLNPDALLAEVEERLLVGGTDD